MSVSHRFRNFGETKSSAREAPQTDQEDAEDQKLVAFEAGYQAGWDDATKAQSDSKEEISSELGQNLLDMSFTYHEALSKLTVSLEPAMRQIIEKLLPEVVQTALGSHILEQVKSLLDNDLARPVEIVVCPNNIERVHSIVQSKLPESFVITGEPTLGDGQAFVRIGDSERQVDLDTTIAEVSKTMTAFFHETAQGSDDG